MDKTVSFADCFKALTGWQPFLWQTRLFERLIAGDIPARCNIPTGLGKTAIIPIWLIALAQAAGRQTRRLPRRLVYIVNRRTVVDQATNVVEQIRRQLLAQVHIGAATETAALPSLSESLCKLSATGDLPLVVSTLRGELADNEEWKGDPTRPAVIVGTIDMIGSKLLFSGYGDGRYGRPHHAGLIGQDALIVHDEAHLTPAFSDLLWAIEREQRQCEDPRPLRVLELSATLRGGDDAARIAAIRLRARDSEFSDNNDVFGLSGEDEKEELVRDRLRAVKRLRLHPLQNGKLQDRLAKLAGRHEGAAKVLVYVRSPEQAQTVMDQLKKKVTKETGTRENERIALLTGTVRGYERDQLVEKNPVYRAFLDHGSRVEHTVYLVSTSAGEVGIDLDADHMVCDLTTLDSMIQRLGRVNRCGGEARKARVDVVWDEQEARPGDKASPIDKAIAETLGILQAWSRESGGEVDASPRNLRQLVESLSPDKRDAAFSPKPVSPPLSDILLDNWSLTSIDTLAGRPEVAAYLHGLAHDPPQTYVAWRKEVRLFSDLKPSRDGLSEEVFRQAEREFRETLRRWFGACRIESQERLQDRTDRVKKVLDALLKAHRRKNQEQDFSVVLLEEGGRAECSHLSEIVKDESKLRYGTVVLPAEAGGLNQHGMLDGKVIEPIEEIDVAEEAGEETRRRERWVHIQRPDAPPLYRNVLTGKERESRNSPLSERMRIALQQPDEGAEDEQQSMDLVLWASPLDLSIASPERVRFKQSLDEHTDRIVQHATAMANALWPSSNKQAAIRNALIEAARWHDQGKHRPVWQRFASNDNGAEPLAKSVEYRHGRVLGGYRHEFGSLLEAAADERLQEHSERELILHLIAAHHGWARPHFEPQAYDHEQFSTQANENAAAEVVQRFGRLQQRLGRWGLAWLESLLRCADCLASKQAEQSAGSVAPAKEQR